MKFDNVTAPDATDAAKEEPKDIYDKCIQITKEKAEGEANAITETAKSEEKATAKAASAEKEPEKESAEVPKIESEKKTEEQPNKEPEKPKDETRRVGSYRPPTSMWTSSSTRHALVPPPEHHSRVFKICILPTKAMSRVYTECVRESTKPKSNSYWKCTIESGAPKSHVFKECNDRPKSHVYVKCKAHKSIYTSKIHDICQKLETARPAIPSPALPPRPATPEPKHDVEAQEEEPKEKECKGLWCKVKKYARKGVDFIKRMGQSIGAIEKAGHAIGEAVNTIRGKKNKGYKKVADEDPDEKEAEKMHEMEEGMSEKDHR